MPSLRSSAALILLFALSATTRAQPDASRRSSAPRADRPAEEARLNPEQFRDWLKKRGLSELLELHLKDFPPTDPTATLLLHREFKLAEFADGRRSSDERQAAIAEANRVLEQLIEDFSHDARNLEWRRMLVHSLLYDEAEPFATRILYFGGGGADRRPLSELSARAVSAARTLVHRIVDEYRRIDGLSTKDFEEIERRGYLEALDKVSPVADYLLLWTLFYDTLPRAAEDAVRIGELREIVDTLAVKPAFLQTPHERSRIQAPALLLAGMVHRRLHDHVAARDYLQRAVVTSDRLSDAAEKERIGWAVRLAMIEMVRNHIEDGQFDEAREGVVRLGELADAQGGEGFGLRLVGALLERSIHRARVATAPRDDRAPDPRPVREPAWMPLHRLAQAYPERKDAIYATLYEMLATDMPFADLDPFEHCALMAGLLGQAEREPQRAAELTERAISAGELLLTRASEEERIVLPEALFQLGVARYRRGEKALAAERFREIAQRYPRSAESLSAASLAVQLTYDLRRETTGDATVATQAYREALETLLTHHPDDAAAAYWRFFYAQLLEETGEFDFAAEQFAKVDPSHEFYVESAFLRLRACAEGLQREARASTVHDARLSIRADQVMSAYREFLRIALDESDQGSSRSLLIANARLMTAEGMTLTGVDRPTQAIELMSDFETAFPEASEQKGRLWRARLFAFQGAGQMEEAKRALDEFVAADPAHAGETLQSLYASLGADVDRLRAAGDAQTVGRKADLAVLLAEQVVRWAETSDPSLLGMDRRALTVQWAEACLRAGHADRAQQLFEQLAASATEPVKPAKDATDRSATFGRAESLYQQGRFAEALPLFNQLATTLAADDPVRWKSLLRDLRCRTSLGHPPAGILQVIAQQKFLHAQLGGPELAAEFDRLRQENERRRDGQ